MMDYANFIKEAKDIVDSRDKHYGDIEANLGRIASIFALISGVTLTNREVALLLHSMKLARCYENPEKPDHYLDGVNYLAFAGIATASAQRDAKLNAPVAFNAPTLTAPPALRPLNLGERAVAKAVSDSTGN